MTQPTRFPDEPFTPRTARGLGISRKRLAAAVQNREVRKLFRGCYLRADIELTTMTRARAIGLVANPDSVICDRTAAWLHGVSTFDFAELDADPPLEAYVLRGQEPTERPECDGGTRDLLPCDWMMIEGVRVTTPVRTAMDLGCKLSRRNALAAMDALARAHGFGVAEMTRLLPRYFRRRGVIQLRQLVPLVDARAESQSESWVRLEIEDRGLPTPTPQHWIVVDGVPTYRLDLAYPHARVAIEYDGEEFHSGAEARRRDAVRREWLRQHGWTVIVLTKESFTEEAIMEWIGEIRCALRLAA